jgi:carboxyl-terminal processing protease
MKNPMSLTRPERTKILGEIKSLILAKHFDGRHTVADYRLWEENLDARTGVVAAVDSDEKFEEGVRAILDSLGSSHTAFIRRIANDMPAQHAINATVSAFEQAGRGAVWMFQDVIEDGIAFRAGIKPGDILSQIDGHDIRPPNKPAFSLGATHQLTVLNGTLRSVTLEIPNRAAKDRPPLIEPRSVTHKMLDGNIGLIKVASFPGSIGKELAAGLTEAVANLNRAGCRGMIFDLRGNVGGGLGSLRLMSLLCADKRPIGHSFTRRGLEKGLNKHQLVRIGKIPTRKIDLLAMVVKFRFIHKDRSMVLMTEGLGAQPFHGRIAILINEHTYSAAEMVADFAKQNRLATLVGMTTAGQVLGGANFKLSHGYTLRMPVACWYSWNDECIEGKGVETDLQVAVEREDLLAGRDRQLEEARRVLL